MKGHSFPRCECCKDRQRDRLWDGKETERQMADGQAQWQTWLKTHNLKQTGRETYRSTNFLSVTICLWRKAKNLDKQCGLKWKEEQVSIRSTVCDHLHIKTFCTTCANLYMCSERWCCNSSKWWEQARQNVMGWLNGKPFIFHMGNMNATFCK